MRNKKSVLGILVIVLLVSSIGIRIYYVNITSPNTPEVVYNQTERVELDGDFQESNKENTSGYSVKVLDAKFTTYSDFISKYGASEDYLPEGLRPKELVLVEMEFTNTANETGFIFLFNYFLAAESYALKPDLDLWKLAQPKGGGNMKISLKPRSKSYPVELKEQAVKPPVSRF